MQKYVELLKKELESGRKSISSLKGKLKKLKVSGKQVALTDENINDIITTLRNDEEIKVSRGGWFWSDEHFSLKNPNFKNPTHWSEDGKKISWVGRCPWPPPEEFPVLQVGSVWLPDPRSSVGYAGVDQFRSLYHRYDAAINVLLSKIESEKNQEVQAILWKKLELLERKKTKRLWLSTEEVRMCAEREFQKMFEFCATNFDYELYIRARDPKNPTKWHTESWCLVKDVFPGLTKKSKEKK